MPNEITSEQIDRRLSQLLINKGNIFVQSNIYVYHWESDIFALTRSKYAYEYEIKISRSDFRADFKKEKHKKFEKFFKSDSNTLTSVPNYFYYVCPLNLIKKDELPEYAGLIYYVPTSCGKGFVELDYFHPAPKIHGVSFCNKKFTSLAINLSWRLREAKYNFNEIYNKNKLLENEILYLKSKLKEQEVSR